MRHLLSASIACAGLLVAGGVAAQEVDVDAPAPEPVKVRPRASGGATLSQCLALADRNHPDLAVKRAQLARVRAQLDEAHYAPFSAFTMVGGVGLAPTIRGNQLYSPNTDVSLTSNLGVGWSAGINGALPLWTFGKITNLWDAAEANVDVNEAAVEVERDKVRMDVRKAYLGLQLARDGIVLLNDADSQVRDALAALQTDVDNDEGDPIELLKMQTFAAELEVRRSEAEKFMKVARSALRFLTGVDNLQPRDEPLEKAAHELGGLPKYLAAARVYRPEVQMARAGVAAREAQLRLSRSQLYPDVGLALNANFSTAPEVADQINPFVNDPANFFHYGAALVVRWNLDVLPKVARIDQAEAQLQEVIALDRKALGGVAHEVEKAYEEALDWQKRLVAYEKAEGYARKWLVTVQQAIDIGTMEKSDLMEPAKAYAEHRYNVLNAIMNYNMALAQLAQATGWDAIAPGGLR